MDRNEADMPPGNKEYREVYECYAANVDEIRKCFGREDFFISLGFMSFTAM